MNITDEELCVLEQLTYIDGNLMTIIAGEKCDAEKVSKKIRDILKENPSCTVEQFLNQMGLDEAGLKKLESMGTVEIKGGCIEASEWVNTIRYIKGSDTLKNLIVSGTMENMEGTTLAYCFTESEGDKEAIVAFKGTSGRKEWKDNIIGLLVADTLCQKEALDYINELDYENITVTGHSKGGNKAMYVAITSEKVKRCVAFDAQGFSDKFFNKYKAEILARGKNISNYSVSTDFVHPLLLQPYFSTQFYCQGFGISNTGQNHSSNSYLVTDENGKLVLDENGCPTFMLVSENESIELIHNLTIFIMENATEEDKEVIATYTGTIAGMIFADGASNEEVMNFVLSDPDALAVVVAYLVRYMEEYDLTSVDIGKLLSALRVGFLGNVVVSLVMQFLKVNLGDKDIDMNTHMFLDLMDETFLKDKDIDLNELWMKIDIYSKNINITGSTTIQQTGTGKIRDFSRNTYEIQMGVIEKIQNVVFPSVTSWTGYSSEEWYGSLGIPRAIKGINAYFAKVSEKNMESKGQIEKIFEEVAQTDSGHAKNMKEQNANLKTIKQNLLSISVNGG